MRVWWRIAGVLGCAIALAFSIGCGRAALPGVLTFAANWQIAGALAIALIWPHVAAARKLTFLLLCLSVWIACRAEVSALAASLALALYLAVLNESGPPLSVWRRYVAWAAYAFDGMAAAGAAFGWPGRLVAANAVALDIAIVTSTALAVAAVRSSRWLTIVAVLPVVALTVSVAFHDLEFVTPWIALALPPGFVVWVISTCASDRTRCR